MKANTTCMAIGIDTTNNTTKTPSVFNTRKCCRGARQDETKQDNRHSEEKEGNRVEKYFEVAHVKGVGDG